ncbi:hypothetical protein [Aeoliella mucimassa]|uniref:Uncharacterized protein n=1 Tax=Aeoliella mucimassa TaxID=2527972 RepID=A0A518AKD8_9BACT|nr:hypothetical protein [Aeoliella mucimassa]QDU55156.1 hypothetical protein Pan181_13420 [Aeoliella mucimassa]
MSLTCSPYSLARILCLPFLIALLSGCADDSENQSPPGLNHTVLTADNPPSQNQESEPHPPQNITTEIDSTSNSPLDSSNSPLDSWCGIYASTSEVEGYTGTVIAIEPAAGHYSKFLTYRKRYFTDVSIGGLIEQDEITGECVANSDVIYFSEAYGFLANGHITLAARLDEYTKVTINDHVVLMREDALEAYKAENKLYDYGILVRIDDRDPTAKSLTSIKHPSIKILYENTDHAWKDPFVNGANPR